MPAARRPAGGARRKGGAGRGRGAPARSRAGPPVSRLWPTQRGELEAHYLRLSLDDRRLRFHGAVGDAAIRARLGRLDWLGGTLLAIFEGGVLRAAAELSRPRSPSAEAELAISVEEGFRNRGFGTALFAAALAAARNRGARRVALIWLPENRAMAALARRFGARVAFAGGVVEGRVCARWPSPLSFAEEAAFAADGLLRAALAFAGDGGDRRASGRAAPRSA